MKSMKPGIAVSQGFREAVREVRLRGIPHYNRHNTGHGIGLTPYEAPVISDSDIVLEENMVVNSETPYPEIGFGSLSIENTYVLKSGGNERLTLTDYDLNEVC